MKFTLLSTLFVATLTALVAAQGANPVDAASLFEREEAELVGREAEDPAVTYVLREMEEHAQYVKRTFDHIERRSRSVCYGGCAKFTGANKTNCWKKCDAMWGCRV